MKTKLTLRRRPLRRVRRAFTLIEVLLVIVIIGMLATVLIVTVGGTREGAQVDTTELLVSKIASKVEQYANDVGHYPTEAEGGLDALHTKPSFDDEKTKWRGPYVQTSELKDAWGNKLNYEPVNEAGTAAKFRIWSNGPDQQSSTDDDIVYPKKDA